MTFPRALSFGRVAFLGLAWVGCSGSAGGGPAAVDAATPGLLLPGQWPGPYAIEVALAPSEHTLAVVYAEVGPATAGEGAGDERRLWLLLLGEDLTAAGAPVQLDRQAVASGNRTTLEPTVATDGTEVVACWSPSTQVRCFSQKAGSAPALFFQADGTSPTIVLQGGTWAVGHLTPLADGTSAAEAQIVRLSRDGELLATSSLFAEDSYFANPVPLVATESGFALLAGYKSVVLHRLRDDFSLVEGADFDTTLLPWSFQSLAATESEAAIALARPYGAELVHLKDGGVVSRIEASCSSKNGCSFAALRVAGSFVTAWWSDAGALASSDFDGVPSDPVAAGGGVEMVTLTSFRSQLIAAVKEENAPASYQVRIGPVAIPPR